MLDEIKALIKKHREILIYLIFGVLTTLVNYIVYLPCYNFLHLSATLSNILAWIVSVAFAFVTNKPFVFGSHDWSAEVLLPEAGKFVGTRLGSGALETVSLFLLVDTLQLNGNVMKLVVSVAVVVVNYVGSKLLVFRKK